MKHPTGDINIKLVVTADDGKWDAYADYLAIGSATNSGSSNNNQNNNANTTTGLEGVYFIKNVHSGKYLDVTYGSADNGVNIQQWESNGAAAQKFKLVSAGNGYYYLYTGASGYTKVVDVEGKKSANGTNILQYSFNGANNQQFKLQQQADGTYAILTRVSGDKSGLDVYEWSSENGGNVNQWEFWGGACQKWILEKTN